MKRYYFDLVDGNDVAPDEEGIELPDVLAAQEEAALALAALAKEMRYGVAGHGQSEIAIDVRDDHGPVLSVRFDFEDRTLQ